MNIKKTPTNSLKIKLDSLNENIRQLEEALEKIPVTSVLATASVGFALKHCLKEKEKLIMELCER